MMGGTIMGKGGGTGVIMEGGTVKMSNVGISNVEKGVYVGGGKLVMNMGSITIKSGAGNGNYGVGVGVSGGSAELMKVTIMGSGKGMGTGVYMGSEGKMLMMDGVKILQVEKGVSVGVGSWR
ncbi:hypothetical protein m02_10360 [Bartonella bovis m02]|uniref:Right handed beta helix domain-containing protein n=2 Tax=Bartonella bovis TaxID=155194 RepID=N6UP10_9HYPH|nr:hypothetical protein m02_10360 [Bartonella bovis m02]